MSSDICGAASPLLSDPSEGMNLDARTIGWLLRLGIRVAEIGSPLAVWSARALLDREGRYCPNRLGEFALVMAVPADPESVITDLGTVDLPSVLGDGFSESTVWNVSVIVEWNRARSRSPLNVRDVELSGLTFLVDGEELEGYRTVSGNLALRAAMAGQIGRAHV